MRPDNKHLLFVFLVSAASAAPLASRNGSVRAEAVDQGRRQGMAVSAPAGAGRIQDHFRRLHIPIFQPFDYKAAQRDPFLDPTVQITLLGVKRQEVAAKPKPIENYLGELTGLVKSQYTIQGIAYDQNAPMALMGDRACQSGDKIILRLVPQAQSGETVASNPSSSPLSNPPAPAGIPAPKDKSLLARLYATCRFYGLGIEEDLRAGELRLAIKRITPDSVILHVPGCDRELILSYEKDFNPETTTYASTYGPAVKAGVRTASTRSVESTQSPKSPAR